MTEIKPRMVDGVGYCDAGCPRANGDLCWITQEYMTWGVICPVLAARMAVELEAWRCGHFKWSVCGVLLVDGDKFDTIEAAVDALMAEGEE